MKQMDTQLMGLLLETEVTDQELDDEAVSAENYQLRLIHLKNTVTKIAEVLKDDGKLNKSIRSYRLPEIEWIQFDGDIRNWIKFWGQFRKIHEDPAIDKEDKFQMLRQATSSKARALVDSYPPSGENYTKALDHLKNRYAREDCLIEIYVRELVSLITLQATKKSKIPLEALVDKLQTQLGALESLGVTKDKYAAMLLPLVESSLPEETLKTWGRLRASQNNEMVSKNNAAAGLSALMTFLVGEVENNERLRLAYAPFSTGSHSPGEEGGKTKVSSEGSRIPSASTLFTGEDKSQGKVTKCIFCEKQHLSQECFKKMSFDEKKSIVQKKRCCWICLKFHKSKPCRAFVKCFICAKRHYVIMCPDLSENNSSTDKIKDTEKELPQKTLSTSNKNKEETILLKTLLVKAKYKNREDLVRVFLDDGSQKSYILKECAVKLNLEKQGEQIFSQSVFGGLETPPEKHNIFKITLSNLNNNNELEVSLVSQNCITNAIPRVKDLTTIPELKLHGIQINDFGVSPPKIDVLLGADVIPSLLTGKIVNLRGNLIALETLLGWTLMGGFPTSKCIASQVSHSLFSIQDLWELETIGIKDEPSSFLNINEDETMVHFRNTVKLTEDNRYEIKLPWLEGTPDVESNLLVAKSRLLSTSRRLTKINKFDSYDQVFNEWLGEGIIEKVEDFSQNKTHYLSHHAVIKESSETTKLRPVFNASAKTKTSTSINDCLAKGPNLLCLIPTLLYNFRFRKYGVIADIRKAFLQISIAPEDRDYFRFLWWENYEHKIMKVFRHCRVVFGVVCSPFLLEATILIHLESSPKHYKNTADKLKESFYVDNVVTSLNSSSELKNFISESTELMKNGKFDLRSWVSNCPKVHSEVTQNVASVLGLIWDFKSDVLYCQLSHIDELVSKPVTKRKLLSITQKVFDPIGFSAPLTLIPKILLQEVWRSKLTWDEEVPALISKKFNDWLKECTWLSQCKINRWFFKPLNLIALSLHIFVDASKFSYAACAFLRAEYEDDVSLTLIQAKNRLAPIKPISVPRLELMSALIGARMAHNIMTSLNKSSSLPIQTFFWSDSMVALTWIKKIDVWNIFIQNRVNEIRKLTDKNNWCHVPGDKNPADILTRGCKGKLLAETCWWDGPSWLKLDSEDWPYTEVVFSEKANEERRKTKDVIILTSLEFYSQISDIFNRHSSYSKALRIFTWVRRWAQKFIKLLKRNIINKAEEELSLPNKLFVYKIGNGPINIKAKLSQSSQLIGCINYLQTTETTVSELYIIKFLQKESFAGENKAKLSKFKTFIDKDGILRIKTKLMLGPYDDDFKCPIVLPSDHIIVHRLIEEEHQKLGHVGIQTMLSLLRERFWVVQGRKTVRSVLSRCVKCKRFNAKPLGTQEAPLPQDRISVTSAFEVSGVDMAGPLYLRDKSKVWIVLFTCAVYRAVHLELAPSLSTEAFIRSLRRFIARRGRVSTIYSDNGLNFVGCDNFFKSLDWEAISSYSVARRINWKFIAPSAAWWGGWWERMVRIIKELLRKNLGKASLHYEELLTVMCDCESLINSRPLTYMSDNDEFTPITPSMFLQGINNSCVDDLDQIDGNSIIARHRVIQNIRNSLRSRFIKEYLGNLVGFKRSRGQEEQRNLKVNDIVLVELDAMKKIHWPLAKVIEVIPGKDGIPRVARLRTARGELVRPFQKLFPLELSSEDYLNIKKEGITGSVIHYNRNGPNVYNIQL